jgi:mandelamide amidase
MSGKDGLRDSISLKGLRLGVPRAYFYEPLDPAVAECAETVLSALRKAGVELIEADIPDIGKLDEAVSFPVALHEFIRDLQAYLDDNDIALSLRDICEGVGSPDVRGLFEALLGEGAMPAAVYQEAMTVHRPLLQAAYRDYFSTHDVVAIIFPTAPMTARPIGQDETVDLGGTQVPTFGTFIRNTDPGSNAAIPGISLPAGLSPERLPIGMELDGPAASDERLLAIAAAIEPILGFHAKPELA